MKTLRIASWVLAAVLLASLWVELGLRGAALLWRAAYRSRPGPAALPVYVVGESTAYGEPFAPKISFPKILSLMFAGSLRGRPLEIVNLAKPGSDTESQYWLLLRELALRPRRDGLLLVYAGINETYVDTPPGLAMRWAYKSLLLSRLFYLWREHRGGQAGLDYEHRLARILALARRAGYPAVVSTLTGNLRDFQPDLAQEIVQDPVRNAAYQEALRDESLGRWQQAAELYRRLATGRGRYPGMIHARARCLLRLGQAQTAKKLFQQAADLGGSKRPTSEQDQAIRRQALLAGAALADTRALFEASAEQGVPGYDLFMDAHHPNLRGYLLLAESFARPVSIAMGTPVRRERISEAELRRETGFSQSDQRSVYSSRFLWFCGEAYHRVDPSDALRSARRYLDLAEAGASPLPAFRFLLALVARDRAAVGRSLAEEDSIRRDRESLGVIGCNREWTARSVKDIALPPAQAAQAQKLLDLAGRLSTCAGGGAASPQRRRFLKSKAHADAGIALILSGRGEDGARELGQALEIYPDNVEAALSLCTWQSQRQRWQQAWPYCDLAWRAGRDGEGVYSADFLEQCRQAREKVRLRLPKTQTPSFR
jgi:tetratricopeptide (TPR) repeat protein